jgi:hypothetical protein
VVRGEYVTTYDAGDELRAQKRVQNASRRVRTYDAAAVNLRRQEGSKRLAALRKR